MKFKAIGHPLLQAVKRRLGGPTKTWLVMQLTGLLLLAAVLQVSASGRAQTVTYSAKATPLTVVFSAIEKQTGYVFFYDKEDVKDAGTVTAQFTATPLQQALEQVLSGQSLKYFIQGNTIFITKREPAATPELANVPPGDVHGRVTDSTGKPLEGVNVTVKGTRKGTVTGPTGEFTLKEVGENGVLIFSNVEFETQTVRLAGTENITIKMKQRTSQLDETVVKGYYNTTNRLNTGDVTTVKGEDIEKQPVTDPILALDGRVPGLYIQQTSGVPGTYSTIRIQGQNSIANGKNPYYIVDGVPFSSTSPTSSIITPGVLGGPPQDGLGASPFNDLNPNDIESIEVLKDADATAIYGSLGANGVILITTKHGKAGKTQLSVNSFAGVGKVAHFLHFMNTPQYLAMRHEAIANDGLTPQSYDYDLNGDWDTTRYTNWQKVLIGNSAKFKNINASVSGGNINTQFKITGGYSDQGTVYPGSFADQKEMASFNLTHTSTDRRFRLQMSTNYVYEYSNLPQIDFASLTNLAPDAPALYDASGNINWQLVGGSASWTNPLGSTLQNANGRIDNLISSLNMSYLVFPGLQVKANIGYTHLQNNENHEALANSYPPPYNTMASSRGNYLATSDFRTWILEPQVSYEKTLLNGKFNVLIGNTFQANLANSSGFDTYGYASDALVSDPQAASTVKLIGYSNTLYHYAASFGRVGYDWEGKYLLNITARRDGSSRFGPGKQFGNFGAVGAGWVFTNEAFIRNRVSFLSFGKLRVSYGITGNDQITDYQYLSTYSINSATYQGLTGLYPTNLYNPNFSWESVKKLETGVELGFFYDRIFATAIYYRNRTGNQLVGYPLPRFTGFSSVEANLPAVVQNTGGEFTLKTVNIRSKTFNWTSSFNLTIPENKLVSFPGLSNTGYANSLVVGQSLNILKFFHFAGINDTTGTFQYVTGKGLSNNPSYPQDLKATKPISQRFYGGFENSFTYRNLSLSFLIQYVSQTGFNYFFYNVYGAGAFNLNYPTAILNHHWRQPGDMAHYGVYSTQGAADPNGYLGLSDFGVSNNSFVRLKNLALSYQLPKSLLQKIHFETVRIYIQGENLLTITHNYLGFDPENNGYSLPPLRTITGGIQLIL